MIPAETLGYSQHIPVTGIVQVVSPGNIPLTLEYVTFPTVLLDEDIMSVPEGPDGVETKT